MHLVRSRWWLTHVGWCTLFGTRYQSNLLILCKQNEDTVHDTQTDMFNENYSFCVSCFLQVFGDRKAVVVDQLGQRSRLTHRSKGLISEFWCFYCEYSHSVVSFIVKFYSHSSMARSRLLKSTLVVYSNRSKMHPNLWLSSTVKLWCRSNGLAIVVVFGANSAKGFRLACASYLPTLTHIYKTVVLYASKTVGVRLSSFKSEKFCTKIFFLCWVFISTSLYRAWAGVAGPSDIKFK